MSNVESNDARTSAVEEDVVVEDVTPVPAARRGLEAGALFLAIAGLLAALNAALYVFTAYKLQTQQGAPGPSFPVLVRFMQVLTAQNGFMIIVLPLLTMLVIGVIRGIWRSDSRGRDRTVISATLAVLVALFTLVFSVFNTIETLVKGVQSIGESANAAPDQFEQPINGQLGEAPSAFLTTLSGHLITLVLSIAVIALALLFAFGRDSRDRSAADYDGDETSSRSGAVVGTGDSSSSDAQVGSTKSATPVADSTSDVVVGDETAKADPDAGK